MNDEKKKSDQTVAQQRLSVGIDIGSTTAKVVVLDGEETLFSCYERHFSQVRQKTIELLERIKGIVSERAFTIAIAGSAGLGMAKAAELPFVQEVFATAQMIYDRHPDTDAVIELGGEDAKILFFDHQSGGTEERMNGSCAGGTGAFIDQMATLLSMTPTELDEISREHQHIHTIASRCGVFAKSDIQPLLNQGANKADIAASIFQAVVDQTITGLAAGHKIEGKVVFLGGPLYFFGGLRERFAETLKLTPENAIFPEDALYAVSLGAAIYAREGARSPEITHGELMERLSATTNDEGASLRLPPLFASKAEYDDFQTRHAKATVQKKSLEAYAGKAYLGVDCGSTTTKLVLIGAESEILYEYYHSNQGDPVAVVQQQLLEIRGALGSNVTLAGVAITGYGEELIQNAFHADAGLVETMAHLRAALHFDPQTDFVLDIGGQDIKCFKLKNGVIDNVMLNEACSSGCGSFIETFAKAMGYDAKTFAQLGLFATQPVDLGSRCTVFMNSSVKQAQKEGASAEDISAGLSMSVAKNAIYKVIRAASRADLGERIVVQGGTFLSDAVLRSFEQELGVTVVRPSIAGLMGAYGAALYAQDLGLSQSTLLSLEELEQFSHQKKSTHCRLCTNNCNLTVNTFQGNDPAEKPRKFISGNRCDRPLGHNTSEAIPNIYEYKLGELLALAHRTPPAPARGTIGIPLGLNMYENLPFWHAFFSDLGFAVVTSDLSSRTLYRTGQDTIPSDTVCYPAKLMHGHIQNLIDKGVKHIFYPCMPYNIDEKKGDNHYNCPVVAYYPELLDANMDVLQEVTFYREYLSLHHRKNFPKKILEVLGGEFPLTLSEVKRATSAGYRALEQSAEQLRKKTEEMIAYARREGRKMIVLAGRPYHIDPEINHGIDLLLRSFGLVVLSEDGVAHLGRRKKVNVLNQWTYHARLYETATYVATQPDMELVQIISFGCGIDAISSDEVRHILEEGGKLYTGLKIDEINNLGAIKIRIRSLLAAIEKSH